LSGLLLYAAGAVATAQVPQMLQVTPRTAKPGSVLNVTGIALEKAKVEELFLTDHKFDMKVKILEQESTSLKFRVPPFAKPGRMQLLVQTGGDTPRLLEQPVYVLIEERTEEAKKDEKDKDKEKEKDKAEVGGVQ